VEIVGATKVPLHAHFLVVTPLWEVLRLSPIEGTTYIHFCILHSKKIARRLQWKIHFDSPRSLVPSSPCHVTPLSPGRAAVPHVAPLPRSRCRPHAAALPSLAPPPLLCSCTPPPLEFPPRATFWSPLRVERQTQK
jgi:hypothetical protein